jgi:Predicted dehydrogenases and related proteins
MSTGKYKLGIIGIGEIAEMRHLPAVRNVKDFDIVGAYDISSERLEYVNKTYSIPVAETMDELFSKKCDAVYIATPNTSHVQLAIEALKNGVVVLLEKPCAVTLDEADLLLQAANKAKQPLLVAYMHKWNRNNQKARQLVKDGCIGELLSYTSSFSYKLTNMNSWRPLREKAGLGALADIGIYAISTGMDIFEKMPVSCYAQAYPAGNSIYGDKFLSGRVNFTDGQWMQIDTSFLNDACGYTVLGTKGAVHVANSWRQSGEGEISLCTGKGIEYFKEEEVNPYEQELICLKNCLDGKPVPAVMSIDTAVKDIKVMVALDKSATLMGKEVAIS